VMVIPPSAASVVEWIRWKVRFPTQRQRTGDPLTNSARMT